MSLINRDTNDPVTLALRSDLKKHFLVYLETNDDMHQWPGAELVVFGSTLMRKLIDTQNVELPYWGRKASDVDISVQTQSYMTAEEYRKKFHEVIPQLICNTLKHGKFNVELPTKKEPAFEVISGPQVDDYFKDPKHCNRLADEFVISQSYSKEDTIHILRKAKKFELANQVEHSDQESYYADSIISVQDCPPHMLLNATNFLPDRPGHEGKIDLKRDTRMNLLTSKIVRAFDKQQFKATDFIDIYNLLHAKPSLFDFDPQSETNVLEHLRCMIVAHMAGNGLHRLDERSSDLMKNFTVDDAQIKKFVDACEPVISTDQKIDAETAKLFLQTARDLVFHAFGHWDDNTKIKLESLLTLNERNFLASQYGYRLMPGGYTESLDGDMHLNTAYLKAEHPSTFEKYPELEHNLKNYPWIVERVQANYEAYNNRHM